MDKRFTFCLLGNHRVLANSPIRVTSPSNQAKSKLNDDRDSIVDLFTYIDAYLSAYGADSGEGQQCRSGLILWPTTSAAAKGDMIVAIPRSICYRPGRLSLRRAGRKYQELKGWRR
jgi:hypothetical protein